MTRSEKRRVRKMGRLVELLGLGSSVTCACAAVGVGTSTFYRWLELDEVFDEQVEEVRCAKLCEVLTDLGVQAKGQYVTEEVIRGEEVVTRRRWVNGRTSASRLLMGNLTEEVPEFVEADEEQVVRDESLALGVDADDFDDDDEWTEEEDRELEVERMKLQQALAEKLGEVSRFEANSGASSGDAAGFLAGLVGRNGMTR